MTPQRLSEVRALYERLTPLAAGDRRAVLGDVSGADPDLAGEVEALLRARALTGGLIGRPLIEQIEALASDEPEASLEGETFGDYRLGRSIGRGGMGEVYEAERVEPPFLKRAAVKVIHSSLAGPHLRARFRQECQILATLSDHPGITRILDGGTTEAGRAFLVMEYVDGEPIDRHCRARALDVPARLRLFLRACDAVQHAHRHLIVHRDIKPGNILVTPEGAVKLLDFGIAKILGPPTVPAGTERTALWITPEYASPEQLLLRPVTTLTDVYQLGLLLYELLTGAHPYRREDRPAHEIMRAICEEEPPRPGAAVPRLRGDLDHIVLRALRKEPESRYASVEQLAADVERHLEGRPVLARGRGLGYRAGRFLRRNWLPVTSAALLVASLAAGVVASGRQAGLARRERALAEEARARATAQEALAEGRRREAERRSAEADAERRRADGQRRLAERRHHDLRALVTTLVFDLHDGIRDLPGASAARRLTLQTAQRYLEELSRESAGDVPLQRELAASYDRMGDLLTEAVGGTAADGGSLAYYTRAHALRAAIAAEHPGDPAARRDLAYSLAKVGEGHFLRGDVQVALAKTREGLAVLERAPRLPADDDTRYVSGFIHARLGVLLAAAGDTTAGLESARQGVRDLEPLLERRPRDRAVRSALANGSMAVGTMFANTERPEEALPHLQRAAALLDELSASEPNNAYHRRQVATTRISLGHTLAAQGDARGAAVAYEAAIAAMRALLSADAPDARNPLTLAYTLTKLAQQRRLIGETEEGAQAMAEAIALFRGLAERPGAGALEFNEYANALAKSDFTELHQPKEALRYAVRAARATLGLNPMVLDTLAWAYYENGDREKAVATARQALGLLPPAAGPADRLRREIQEGLTRFEVSPVTPPPHP